MEKKQEGWSCPRCNKIHSPKVQECNDCNCKIKVDESISKNYPTYILNEG